jgi:hypothetical protein
MPEAVQHTDKMHSQQPYLGESFQVTIQEKNLQYAKIHF